MGYSFSARLLRYGIAAAAVLWTVWFLFASPAIPSPGFFASLALALVPTVVAWLTVRAYQRELWFQAGKRLAERSGEMGMKERPLTDPLRPSWLQRQIEEVLADAAVGETMRQDQNRALAHMLDILANGLVTASPSGLVHAISPEAARFWNVAETWRQQLLHVDAVFHRWPAVYDSWREAVGSRMPLAANCEFDDSKESLLVVHQPVVGRGGEQLWYTACLDTSELTRSRLIRRDFIGNLSHEMRNTLAKMRANVEMMEATRHGTELPGIAGGRTSPEHRLLATIGEMHALQEGLMDLYMIETGLNPVSPSPTHLPTFLAGFCDSAEAEILASDLVLCLERVTDLSLPVDQPKISRVLTNLVHNAIKFTPPGGAINIATETGPLPHADPAFQLGLPSSLSGAERARLAPVPMVMIRVRDSGPGIPLMSIARVFERLNQLEGSQEPTGTGLGLSLAWHTMRAHGGLIWGRNNQPGPGITFTIALPLPDTDGTATRSN